jgi:hypothetical protein
LFNCRFFNSIVEENFTKSMRRKFEKVPFAPLKKIDGEELWIEKKPQKKLR